MPDLTIAKTSISAPDVSGAKHVRAGIVDNSKAVSMNNDTSTFQKVSGLAQDVYEGSLLGGIESEQNNNIQEYMDRKNPESLFEAAVKHSPVTEKFTGLINRYKNALDQGAMSPEEFETRSLSSLRQAVNKNPALMKELTDQTNKVLVLSGMKDIIKADKAAATSKAEEIAGMQKFYLSLAKQHNISLPLSPAGNVDFNTLVEKVRVVQNEKNLLETAERQASWTEDQFRSYGSDFVNAKVNEAQEQVLLSLQDTSISIDKQLLNMNFIMDSVERTFIGDPRIGKILDKPAVKAAHDSMVAQVAAFKENIKKFTTREELSLFVKNNTEIMRNQQSIDVMRMANPQAIELTSKLITTATYPYIAANRPDLLTNTFKAMSRLLEGVSTKDESVYKTDAVSKIPYAAVAVDSLATDAGIENSSPHVQAALSNAVTSIAGDAADMDVGTRFNFNAHYIKSLGATKNQAGMKTLTDEARVHATSAITDYTDLTMNDMGRTLDKYSKQGVKIKVDVLPDGRILFDTDNPKITNELTRRFGLRINDSLKAYTNVKGYSNTTSAAPEFYQQYSSLFNGQSGDEAVVTKMKAALAAGATIEDVASLVRRPVEWVQERVQ